MRKKNDGEKLDKVISMIGGMTEDFGARFDNLDDEITAVKSKVDGVNKRLDSEAMLRGDQKIPERVEAMEKHLGIDKKIAA